MPESEETSDGLAADVRNLNNTIKYVVERIDKLESYHCGEGQCLSGRVSSLSSPNQMAAAKTVVNGTESSFRAFSKPYGLSRAYDYVSPFPGVGLQYLDENRVESCLIGLCKGKNDPDQMGISVREENGQLVVSGVADGSPIAKQGVLRAGDAIVEVNGCTVATADALQQAIKAADSGVCLKVIPAASQVSPDANVFVKAYFDYDPTMDASIPCKEIGLPFKTGDVMEILSREDNRYWQAKRVTDGSKIGLIPAHDFDAKPTEDKGGKGKKKNAEKAAALPMYEEVGRLTPYGRRVVMLVGARGVGRRTLKGRLLKHDIRNFATVVPCTSRTPRAGEVDGREYNFKAKADMKKGIDAGEYLEWGEYNGNFYGTTIQSVRQVVKSGKVCVLDCSPQAIKQLYNWEFMPFIVFINPPPLEELKQLYATVHRVALKPKSESDLAETCTESQKIEAVYKQVFDLTLTNRNAEVTFRRLMDALESLKSQPQWVPVSWISY